MNKYMVDALDVPQEIEANSLKEAYEKVDLMIGIVEKEADSSCKDCGKTHCDSKCICGACEKCLDSSCECGLNPNEYQSKEQRNWETECIKESGKCSACANSD